MKKIYELVPAQEKDMRFIYECECLMVKEWIRLCGEVWDDDWRYQDFLLHNNAEEYQIIKHDDELIGELSIEEDDRCIDIRCLALKKDWQKKGFGTQIIRDIKARCPKGKSVVAEVYSTFRWAKEWFLREGFTISFENDELWCLYYSQDGD